MPPSAATAAAPATSAPGRLMTMPQTWTAAPPEPPLLARWVWLDALCRLGFKYGILKRWLGLKDAYVVCKRRPLSELSPEKQQQIRQAYKDTDWSSDYSIEFVEICTDEVGAIEAASIPGGFIQQIPINAALPDVPIRYGRHTFPLSPAREMYEEQESEIMAVRRSDMEQIMHKACEVKQAARQAMNKT
jgi:hypothetical protein